MDESILHRNLDGIDERKLFFDVTKFPEFRCEDELRSQSSLANLMKHSLLDGAEKLLMARNPARPFACPHTESCYESGADPSEHRSIKTQHTQQQIEKVHGRSNDSSVNSHSTQLDSEVKSSDDFHSPKEVNSPSRSYNELPLDILGFATVILLKMAGFQINLFLRLISFPLWLLNFYLMMFMFPLQTLRQVRQYTKQKLQSLCNTSCLRLISLVRNRVRAQKSLLKMVLRLAWAFLCSIYVFLLLAGLLVSGFVLGALIVRNFLEEPVHRTEILNFDYTKTNPVASVPMTSCLVPNVAPGSTYKHRMPDRRVIPYNHRLKLTVSLTLPESEYNRKLGIFQVRVESLSGQGKAISSSSYPTMLRFKSHPIRLIETTFKAVPLLTGFQSEVQNLNIEFTEFTEGHEPTACFKVFLEQRAEFQGGSGVPEIYAASMQIESKLPRFKRVAWNWRRTGFVWISISTFLGELMAVMIFCRPLILPGGRVKAMLSKRKSPDNKISWKKSK